MKWLADLPDIRYQDVFLFQCVCKYRRELYLRWVVLRQKAFNEDMTFAGD